MHSSEAAPPGGQSSDALREQVERLEREALLESQLHAVLAQFSRAETVHEVARLAATQGRAMFGAEATLVYLLDEAGRQLEVVWFGGVPAARVEPWARVAVDGADPLPEAVRTGQPVLSTSRGDLVSRWPHLASVTRDGAPLQAVITCPLRDVHGIIGGLAFSFYQPLELNPRGRSVLEVYASQCGTALERVRFIEADRRARTELRVQRERLDLLAEASRLLAATLDPQAAMEQLARAVVPTLCEWCAIDELTPDGTTRRLALHHRDPSRIELATNLERDYPAARDDTRGRYKVLRTGATEWYPEIPDALLQQSALDARHLELLRALDLSAIAIVPVVSRDGILGSLTLASAGERRLTSDDVRFAEELARRAGFALENARLYQTVTHSELRMRALVEATTAVVWSATADGRVVEGSPSWTRFTGQEEQDYLHGGFAQVIHPDDRQAALQIWQAAVASGAPYVAEYRLRRADGTYAHTLARARPVRGLAGDIAEYIGCNIDISTLREAEARAQSHARVLSSLNQLSHVVAAEPDTRAVVQAITDAATDLSQAQFGAFFYNVADHGGGSYMLYTISGVDPSLFSRFPMPRTTEVFAPTFLGEGVVRSADITADPRYGHNAPHHGMPVGHLPVRSYLAVPVISRTTEVIGGIFLGHSEPGIFGEEAEATVIRLAEKASLAMDNARLHEDAQRLIRQLEATNRELDQFAYVTSHDLKAPLRGIGSLAEWIEEDLAAVMTDDARDKLGLLRRRVHRMEGLIQGILDFSRVGRLAGRREEVAVRDLVLEVWDLLGASSRLSLAVAQDLPRLHTERIALQQVFLNLLGNAVKHGAPAGRVGVEVRDVDDRWQFRVSDDGPGIAPEFHERIWGIFQTLQARDTVESTGIGLAVVRKIVEGRGGRAWVESSEGEGATFCFTWPKVQERRP